MNVLENLRDLFRRDKRPEPERTEIALPKYTPQFPLTSSDIANDPDIIEASPSLIDLVLGPPEAPDPDPFGVGMELEKRGVNPRLARWAVENLDLRLGDDPGSEYFNTRQLDFLAERLVPLNDTKAGHYPELAFPTVREGEPKIRYSDVPSPMYIAANMWDRPQSTLGMTMGEPEGVRVMLRNRPSFLEDDWMKDHRTQSVFPHEMHHVGQYLQGARRGEDPRYFRAASLPYSRFSPYERGYDQDAEPREIEATIAADNAMADPGTPVWDLPVSGMVFGMEPYEEDPWFDQHRRAWGRDAMGYTPGMSEYTWRDRARNLTRGLLDW